MDEEGEEDHHNEIGLEMQDQKTIVADDHEVIGDHLVATHDKQDQNKDLRIIHNVEDQRVDEENEGISHEEEDRYLFFWTRTA